MVARVRNGSASSRASNSNGAGSGRYRVWLAAAVFVVVGGVVCAVVAARSVAHTDAAKSRQAFAQSSDEVASTLRLAIQHEDDLIVDASGFVVGDPHASNAELRAWATSVHLLTRYPELDGFGHSVIVPRAQLPAFAAHAVTDPSGPLGPHRSFQLIPPGPRPFYCLVVAGVGRIATTALPAGFDLCSSTVGYGPLSTRDSGQRAFLPLRVGATTSLSVVTPIYQGGAVPTTVKARRQAFLGWVGMNFVPHLLLQRALAGHQGMGLTLRRQSSVPPVAFQAGKAPPGARSVVINLRNGWTVQTFGAVVTGGMFANGSALALLLAGLGLSTALGLLLFVLGTGRGRALRLVDERTRELRHQALHDALTGLPNRALITDRIEQLLARNRRNGTPGAVLFVDLDEFKNVNDTLGHEVGDRLLVAVASRLTSVLRDADTIGRMGGDEFVALIDGGELKAAPELVAERVLDVMRQPFALDGAGLPLTVNTSIGIAIGDRTDAVEFLRDADVALYEAKAAGKNRYAIFQPEMQTELSRRTALEFELRSALQDEQFRLVYQPTYNLDDLTLVGAEALLRWDHPTQGLLQPDDFVPILEQTGEIREVGRWVLRDACRQMATWHALGYNLDLSVNISGRQLDDDAIIDHIRDALTTTGLKATKLIIEVTETALMRNATQTAERLKTIKQLGVRIAVDDFGTGYSSLAYLQQFPVDCLKIDRRFTNAITSSPESKALITTLVQLGKDLGLTTLAEGVETTSQIDHLRNEHVDEAQGFLLSQPLDPETLETKILAPTQPRPGVPPVPRTG